MPDSTKKEAFGPANEQLSLYRADTGVALQYKHRQVVQAGVWKLIDNCTPSSTRLLRHSPRLPRNWLADQMSLTSAHSAETPGVIRPLRNNKRATSVRVFQLLGLNAAVLEHVWKYAALIQLRHLLLVSRLPPGLRAWC